MTRREGIAVTTDSLCDFCSARPVTALFDCGSFPLVVPLTSAGAWAACSGCATLVRASAKNELLRRAAEAFLANHPDERTLSVSDIENILRPSYDLFFRLLRGDAK